ncbi:hypothetical protein [Niveispirillum fermenti]|uniref:hypothetical protein n=1 Tax=Niveispirillum fermenti TaxID=1233113 RepID=UPI003A83D0EE
MLRHGRTLFAGLLLLALFLRAMIPPGYMPDLSAMGEGGLPLVICTGGLDSTLLVDKNGQPLRTADMPAPGDSMCLFAALAALPGPLLLALALLLVFRIPARLVRQPASYRLSPSYLRPPGDLPPRAPPAFA